MKQILLIIIVVTLTGVTASFITRNSQDEQYKIVKLRGCSAYTNFAKSEFSWIAGPGHDSISALPLYDGDLLYLFTENDHLPFYRYEKSDGNFLEFHTGDFLLYLNGKIIAIEISDDRMVMDWLSDIDSKDIHDLRYLSLTSGYSQVHIPYLKKIATVKPDIGLYIDEDIRDFTDVLQLFDPEWIVAAGCGFDDNTQKAIGSEKNIELLYVSADNQDLNIISKLSGLEVLILQDMYQPEDDKDLINNSALRSLTIIRSGIRDISFLSNLNNLTELNLLECDSLIDISSLKSIRSLEGLSLINCRNLMDISVFDNLTSLRRVSFNPQIAGKELEYFTEKHKNIEAVELIGCTNIKDISSFKTLKKLSCLTYFNTEIDLNSVYDLERLRYLSLPDSIYNDPLTAAELQEKLPNCVIVPAAGLCLGSGWLLLIIPALILGRVIFMFNKRHNN